MNVDPDLIFSDLPTDPHLASYELLNRIDEALRKGQQNDADYGEACGYLEAFYELNNWKVPPRINTGSFAGDSPDAAASRARSLQRLQYEAYVAEIMGNYKFVAKRKATSALKSAMAQEPGYAVLEPDEKKEVHKHIEKIRTIIEESGLDDRKKNSLFSQLAELAREVNRNGTRTDRFFAFASELGFTIGQFTKNAKPAVDETKEILKIIMRARERHDGIKLPPAEDRPLLPFYDDDNEEESESNTKAS